MGLVYMEDAFRNPDGSFNGARLLAAMAGTSEAGVLWRWRRIKELKTQGLDVETIKKQVTEEAKLKPWIP